MKKILLIYLFIFSLSSFAGTTKISAIWEKDNLSVCWWNGQNTSTYLIKSDLELSKILKSQYFEPVLLNHRKKIILQKLVESHFSKDITGIHFKGWVNCSEISNPDIVLFGVSHFKEKKDIKVIDEKIHESESLSIKEYSENTLGRASIGQKQEDPSTAIFLFRNSLSFNDKMTFLHEFTHLAGLIHEHYRPQALSDPRCEFIPQKNQEEIDNMIPHPATTYTSVYDPFSITNYCYETTLRFLYEAINFDYVDIQPDPALDIHLNLSDLKELSGLKKHQLLLSKGDIHALRCMYIENMDKDICHQEFNLDGNNLNNLYQKYLELVL